MASNISTKYWWGKEKITTLLVDLYKLLTEKFVQIYIINKDDFIQFVYLIDIVLLL